MPKKAVNRLYVITGTFFLALGITGIVIPVLPTTPFLLLAAACYAKGSERWYKWLLGNRVFGRYIKNYLECKTVPVKIKVLAILILWTGIGLTVAFGIEHTALRITLIVIAIAVTMHISMLKPKTNVR